MVRTEAAVLVRMFGRVGEAGKSRVVVVLAVFFGLEVERRVRRVKRDMQIKRRLGRLLAENPENEELRRDLA